MKQPLGFVALLYAGGLVLAEFLQPPLALLFTASLAVAAAAIVSGKWRPILIWPLIFLAAWTNLVGRTAIISPHDLRRVLSSAPEEVAVRGHLLETPTQRIYLRDETESSRTLAQISVMSVRRSGQWQPAFGEVMATLPGTLPEGFHAGQEVEVAGICAPPAGPLAEGLFDYRHWLQRQGIHFTLKTFSAGDWRLLSAGGNPPLSDRFRAWARSAMARGLPEEDRPLRLLWSMTLGSKDVLTSEAYDPFTQSGTMHIFAISGLHIALIAGILVSLLRVLQVSRLWCGIVVIPLIWFYTGATGWQSSAVRSTVMMSIVIAGWSLKRPSHLLNSLAAAALVILVWDPQQLFQASFQLSFFVVLSIALLLPPLERVRDRLLQPDPFLPAELLPRWKRWLGTPLRAVTTGAATSLAAWLGALPLTAYYFHLFSPVTLLANLVIVPLSSFALMCNLGSLLCAAWFPWATELFNHSGWFWMTVIMRISEAATAWPGAFFYVRSPWAVDFVVYYGVLIAVLSGFALAAKRRAAAIAVAVCVLGFYGWRWQEARRTTEITVLPLNGGSSVYCDGADWDNDCLVDCGNAGSVEFVLEPFLRAQGVNRLPRLVLTHGDLRQVGGAEMLQAIVPVEQIAVSPVRFRSGAYRSVVEALEKTPGRRAMLNRGGGFGRWTVLHPDPADRFPQADDNAVVLSGDFGGARVLLLSDLGRPGQNALLERVGDLRADIVVAGLPEQSEPLCDPLLEAIQPRLIVVVDSEFPATRRANARLRERLARRGTPVVYTRSAGAVTISLRGKTWEARAMDGFRLDAGTSR